MPNKVCQNAKKFFVCEAEDGPLDNDIHLVQATPHPVDVGEALPLDQAHKPAVLPRHVGSHVSGDFKHFFSPVLVKTIENVGEQIKHVLTSAPLKHRNRN